MPRPMTKMDKDKLKLLIENPKGLAWAVLARMWNCDHTTVLYWVRKLRREGISVKMPDTQRSASRQIIEELKKELRK